MERIEVCFPFALVSEKSSEAPALLVVGIVYEPRRLDAHGDWTDEEVIQEAAHHFLLRGPKLRRMHSEDLSPEQAGLVESFLAPQELQYPRARVQKGTWIVVVRVQDPELRRAIREGALNGFSMGGFGWRKPAPFPGFTPPQWKGKTHKLERFLPWELSFVDLPANQRAFLQVKQASVEEALQVLGDLPKFLEKEGSA